MESVEHSPIAIALAQLVILVINAILYSRQKNGADNEKRERAEFRPKVEQAYTWAQDAKRGVETVELDHYKKLLALFQAQAAELAEAKAKIAQLEESLASLSNKLASRERADRSAAKRAAQETQEPEAEELPAKGKVTLDDLIRNGAAIPLTPEAPPPSQTTFGKVVR